MVISLATEEGLLPNYRKPLSAEKCPKLNISNYLVITNSFYTFEHVLNDVNALFCEDDLHFILVCVFICSCVS